MPTSTSSKRIHGKVGSYTLTRAYYDSAVRSANNRAALKACATYFPTYSTTNLECDEFPFQSTYEGARLGPDRFSVRPISKEANSSGGGQLSGFYRYHRILDTYDQFWVLPGTAS